MLRLGIDIGGTSAKIGLVDIDGSILERQSVATGREMDGPSLLRALAGASKPLRKGGLFGVGVAAPGMRRPDGEGVVNVSNLPLLDGYPLRSRLSHELELPVQVDNDANAAAVGEFRFGAGAGSSRLLVVTLGTGIGAGMVVDGHVHRVACEGLGDPGHVIVAPFGPRCACGGRGCAETVAAVPAILRKAGQVGGKEFPDLLEAVSAARQGSQAMRRLFEQAGGLIGVAVASLVHLLAPDRVLLGGGGIDGAGDLLLPAIRSSLFEHVQPYLGEKLHFARAALGNDAGIIGAAALIRDSGPEK